MHSPPRSITKRLLFILSLALLLGLSGCKSIITPDQTAQSDELILRERQTIGQSFVTELDGLSGVEFYLAPHTPGQGEISLHLRNDYRSTQDIAVARLPLESVTRPGYYRFNLHPQRDSRRTYYYAFMKTEGDGAIKVSGASGDAYLDGALYQDGMPSNAQTAFRLVYNPLLALVGLVKETVEWAGILVLGAFLFVIPGWGLLSCSWAGWERRAWEEKLGLAVGFSLAVYPLLLLWTDVFGLHLGRIYAWLPPLFGSVLIVMKNIMGNQIWQAGRGERRIFIPNLLRNLLRNTLSAILHSPNKIPTLALLVVLSLIILSRFWAIRSLDAPMWGDSYQHTVIAQLFYDQGGYFDTWEPYTPYGSFTVQHGFSVDATLFAWLSGQSSVRASLIVGQLVNVMAVIAIIPLAGKLAGGNRWAGIGAVLMAGLLSPMPAFYVNWGRYAQLAGQAILPVALWMVWDSLEDIGPHAPNIPSKTSIIRAVARSWPKWILSGAILAGMMLTYYRMPFYYATFVVALLVTWGISRWRLNLRPWLTAGLILVVIAGMAVIAFLPWGLPLIGGHLYGSVEAGITRGTPLARVIAEYQLFRDYGTYVPWLVTLLALAGLLWGLIRKRWEILAILLWALALSSLVALTLVRLPGANMMQNFAVLIALYMPFSLLGGYCIGEAMILTSLSSPSQADSRKESVLSGSPTRQGSSTQAAPPKHLASSMGTALLGIGLVVSAIWGATNMAKIAQPEKHAMVTRPDSRAMTWMRENLQPGAQVLVEGFQYSVGKSVAGSDGGWWIPLLAGQENTIPPQYALLNESPIQPGYNQRVVDLVATLEKFSPSSPEGLQAICDWGITHVYIGQGQGRVSFGFPQLFSPGDLENSQIFSPIYRQDRVHLYELNPTACAQEMPVD